MVRLFRRSRILLALLLAPTLAPLLASRATAQTTLTNFVEILFGDALLADGPAQAVAGLGDLNGDGRGDFALAFPQADTAHGVLSGRVLVLSGADRSVLWSFEGDGPGDCFGYAIAAAGDVDADGVRDLLVGAPRGLGPTFGYARVLSGHDGSVLWTLHIPGDVEGTHFGEMVAGDADFDADGHADFLVSQHDHEVIYSTGTLRAYSGATGQVLQTITGYPVFFGGGSIGSLDDVDHDGLDEVLICSQGEASNFLSVRSVVDGHLLQGFFNEGAGCDAGDLDGDGVPDLLTSGGTVHSGATWAPLATMQAVGLPRPVGDVDGDGVADFALGRRLCSGGDGHLLYEAAHTAQLEAVGDVDGDGRIDLLGRSSLPFGSEALSPAGLFRNQPALLHAQVLGDAEQLGFGRSVANAGDVDLDGYADVLVGIPLDDTSGENAGAARLISGRTGATLLSLEGATPNARFGTDVAAAGDVDGDGRIDLVVGAPLEFVDAFARGSARVFSGSDGHLICAAFGSDFTGRFGQAVCAAGDVNGDGFDDIAVGAPRTPNTVQQLGSVTVRAGPDGAELFTVSGLAPQMQLGSSLANAGDIDGDGRDDLLAGAPGTADGTHDGVGSALILAGHDGAVLASFPGIFPEQSFGGSLDTLGDLDGDGAADFVVGCESDNPYEPGGRTVVLSGATGSRLFTWSYPPVSDDGVPAVANAGDVDGDGSPDIVSGLRTTNGAGLAEVRSGATGGTLLTLGGHSEDGVGAAVAGGTDMNGDGLSDIIVGIPGDDAGGLDAGAIRVAGYSPVAQPWNFLGQALQGSQGLPILLGSGSLQPGSAMSLALSRARGSTRTALVIGFHALSMPFKGGTLVPFPDLVQWPILTTGAGTWELNAHWPVGAPPGMSVLFQAWIVDPGAVAGYAASNALQVETP